MTEGPRALPRTRAAGRRAAAPAASAAPSVPALLRWFRRHRRDLPWRHDRTPYRVWISELMLQQTRVDQARPYFERWMRRFPDVASLAAAPRADVLKHWEGLGYYRRALHAHDTARALVRTRGGRFPDTVEGLRALRGVGDYTAAAIASLAFGRDAAVVDGNVARVLSRVRAWRGDAASAAGRTRIRGWAEGMLPRGRAGEFNEALMELGATVCAPRRPRCPACPLRSACRAFAAGDPERFPAPRRRRAIPHREVGAAVVVSPRGRVLIAQRREGAMLGGLWEFPGGGREAGETMEHGIARELREELGIEVEVGPRLMVVRHAFSHFTMDLHAHWARLRRGRPRAIQCAAFRWVEPGALRRFAFARADLAIVARLARRRFDRDPPPG